MLCPMCCARCACPARSSSTCTPAGRGWRRLRRAKASSTRCFPARAPITSSAITPSWKAAAGRARRRRADQARGRRHHRAAARRHARAHHRCRHAQSAQHGDVPHARRRPPAGQDRRGRGERRARAHFVCGFLGCDSRPYNPLLDRAAARDPRQRSRAAARSARISARRWPSPRAAWAASACWGASAS